MNITHATNEVISENLTEQIFERQRELMGKYHDIEKASGLLQTEDCPVNIHDKKGQARIKDFCWRVTEELGEALDAKLEGNIDHFKEELVDGLHFLTELSILAGYTPPFDVIRTVKGIKETVNLNTERFTAKFIMNLGMTANCLKNKPWKQSQMKTDEKEFYSKLSSSWAAYCNILDTAFEDGTEVADIYLKKSQVNKFRQRTGY